MPLPVLNFTRDGIAPSANACPAPPALVRLTEAGPEAWLVTRYDDCKAVLGDRRFLGTGTPPSNGPDLRPLLFRLAGWPGGPDGNRLRRLVTPVFTARNAEALRASITGIAEDLLDAMTAAGGPADLVSAYTFPLPAKVICALFGIADDHIADLARWSADLVKPPWLVSPEAADASLRALSDYFQFELHRKRLKPADDLLSTLGAADEPDELLTGLAISLFIAGHETTTSQLGYGILALLDAPEQAALVRSSDAVAETAVEEIMRYYPINSEGVLRTAAEDVEVGGAVIPSGSLVMVGGPAAMFDAELFPDPLRFDVTRTGAPHLSFGHGAHYCIGSALARVEMRIALPALLRRFPNLRLDMDKVRMRQDAVSGPEELVVTW
ncbi:cytochrome P450 [Lentzea sp. NBRC 105346]|uniref:cytochrome P450 n=1 Tax=Lentzea sp. NBRC 105346 TaxID=3032205 RepID=UPI0024A55884|nr:cytochrome P450 [Lentzea sp. NBRC 105346]GLZ36029.1 cytochrome P450 [Lentzea sp. NBRC 105346]